MAAAPRLQVGKRQQLRDAVTGLARVNLPGRDGGRGQQDMPMHLKLRIYKDSQGFPLRVTQIVDGAEHEVDGIERIGMMAIYDKVRVSVRAIAEVESVIVEPTERD